jgi:hypothetical protein
MLHETLCIDYRDDNEELQREGCSSPTHVLSSPLSLTLLASPDDDVVERTFGIETGMT